MAATTFARGLLTGGETRVFWVVYEDGSTERLETDSQEEPQLHKPGQFVSETVYKKKLAGLEKAKDQLIAGLRAEDNARLDEDYQALLGAGLPEATAKRLSGYGQQEGA